MVARCSAIGDWTWILDAITIQCKLKQSLLTNGNASSSLPGQGIPLIIACSAWQCTVAWHLTVHWMAGVQQTHQIRKVPCHILHSVCMNCTASVGKLASCCMVCRSPLAHCRHRLHLIEKIVKWQVKGFSTWKRQEQRRVRNLLQNPLLPVVLSYRLLSANSNIEEHKLDQLHTRNYNWHNMATCSDMQHPANTLDNQQKLFLQLWCLPWIGWLIPAVWTSNECPDRLDCRYARHLLP